MSPAVSNSLIIALSNGVVNLAQISRGQVTDTGMRLWFGNGFGTEVVDYGAQDAQTFRTAIENNPQIANLSAKNAPPGLSLAWCNPYLVNLTNFLRIQWDYQRTHNSPKSVLIYYPPGQFGVSPEDRIEVSRELGTALRAYGRNHPAFQLVAREHAPQITQVDTAAPAAPAKPAARPKSRSKSHRKATARKH